MESPHPDERPHKKRRFFTEAPAAQKHPKRPASRSKTPPPPPPDVEGVAQPQPESNGTEDAGQSDGFDVSTLQAVVGELPLPTLQKLKDVSGNNVERGRKTR
jgi:DNA repair protein RAD5